MPRGSSGIVNILIIVGAVAAFFVVAWWLLFPPTVSGSVNSAKFDHSDCQYPSRKTNPPNGCDNSDPACPAEIKGGSCEKVVSKPDFSTKVPPAASKAAKPTKPPSCTQ